MTDRLAQLRREQLAKMKFDLQKQKLELERERVQHDMEILRTERWSVVHGRVSAQELRERKAALREGRK